MRDHRFLASIGCILIACAPSAFADTSPGAIVRLYDIGRGVRGVLQAIRSWAPVELSEQAQNIVVHVRRRGVLPDNPGVDQRRRRVEQSFETVDLARIQGVESCRREAPQQ